MNDLKATSVLQNLYKNSTREGRQAQSAPTMQQTLQCITATGLWHIAGLCPCHIMHEHPLVIQTASAPSFWDLNCLGTLSLSL